VDIFVDKRHLTAFKATAHAAFNKLLNQAAEKIFNEINCLKNVTGSGIISGKLFMLFHQVIICV